MPVIHEAADFKSDVSTYFTTRARGRHSADRWYVTGHPVQRTAKKFFPQQAF